MHGIGTLNSFDGCKLYGRWHLGHRHGHFLIQRALAKDCQVILYDTDVPIWSRCMVSSDMLQLQTPAVSVMVRVENLCTETEAYVAEKVRYYTARVKDLIERLNGDVTDTVKACVEQARFHACQHMIFNSAFGISGDDIKVIRVDGERKNVYLRDYDMFSQGVDDDLAAAAAKDVTTTQKLARIVQRLQLSIAQGPEPVRIKRKTKAELQAEATAKAAEAASNDLETAIYEYSDMLRKPEFKTFDKLVLLLTVLKRLPSMAKLSAELVVKLGTMQPTDGDTLRIFQHFFTASEAFNNVDWDGRTYVPSGPLHRGVRKQHKVLVALPLNLFEKIRDVLLNLEDQSIVNDTLKTCEQVREWAYYCDLAKKQEHSRFRTYVQVKNHFAKTGIHVYPPVGMLPADEIQFNDDMVLDYKAEMSKHLVNKRGATTFDASEDPTHEATDASDSDDSVDLSLQLRRFQPLSFVEMRMDENWNRPSEKVFIKKMAHISDSDVSNDSEEEQIKTNNVAVPLFPLGTITAVAKGPNHIHRSRALAQTLAPQLAFSPMKAGGATQRAARSMDRLLRSSDSDGD